MNENYRTQTISYKSISTVYIICLNINVDYENYIFIDKTEKYVIDILTTLYKRADKNCGSDKFI